MWIARKPAVMYEQFSQFATCSYVCGQFEWHIRFPIFNMIPTICWLPMLHGDVRAGVDDVPLKIVLTKYTVILQ